MPVVAMLAPRVGARPPPPQGLDSSKRKYSTTSLVLSVRMGTRTRLLVSPGTKVSVPDWGVKSSPEVARASGASAL